MGNLIEPKSSGLISNSGIYLFSNILNAAVPFFLLPVLTRYLNPTEYGEVAMFQTLVAALSAFVGFNVHGAANRKYYDYSYESIEFKEFISACMQILAVSSLLIFLLLFVFSSYLAQWLGIGEKWILLTVLVSTVNFVSSIRMGQWQVRKMAFKYSVFQVSQNLLNFLMSLLLVVVFLQGADGRILAQVLVPATFGIIAIGLLWRDQLVNLSWRPDYIKEALIFGIPLIPHVAGMFLLSAVDRFFINSSLGLEQAGIYMVAVQLSMAMAIVFDAFNKAYIPWLFERLTRNYDAEKKQIVRVTYLYFLGALGMAGIAFLVGPYVVVIIASDQYNQAGEIIGWLALGQAFGGMYLMVTNYIFYSKKTGLLSLATITSGLINMILLILLINGFGLKGAAIAFAISMFIRFIMTWLVAQKRHPMPWLKPFQDPNYPKELTNAQ